MRGYAALTLNAEGADLAAEIQNAILDEVGTLQGVRAIPGQRWHWVICRWPFATTEELIEAAKTLKLGPVPSLKLGGVVALPSPDRPGTVGLATYPTEQLLTVFDQLSESFYLEQIEPEAVVPLVKISPPSKKVGARLRAILSEDRVLAEAFTPELGLFQQSPDGFVEIVRVPFDV